MGLRLVLLAVVLLLMPEQCVLLLLTSTPRLCTLTHSDASAVARDAANMSLLPGSSTSLVQVKSTAWLCMHCRGTHQHQAAPAQHNHTEAVTART